MEKKLLAQGTRISFDVQNIKNTGKIVGIANQNYYSTSYIVEPDNCINNEVYPYSHIVVADYQIKGIEENILKVPLDEKFINNVCLSYRHDFGLMLSEEQKELVFQCKEWIRSINNNLK